MSVPRYDGLRAEARSFASIGLSAFDSFTLTGSRRSRAAHRPARQRLVHADARHRAGAGAQLHVPTRTCRTVRRSASSATSSGSAQFGGREIAGRRDHPAQRHAVAGRRHHAAAADRAVRPGAGVRAAVFEVGGLTPAQIAGGAGYAQPIARLKPGVDHGAGTRRAGRDQRAATRRGSPRTSTRPTSASRGRSSPRSSAGSRRRCTRCSARWRACC